MRHNDRGLPSVRTPRDIRPEDSTVHTPRADALTYHRVLAKVCPLERWAVIAHRAVTAAEKGDSRAREWLSTFLMGKPGNLIEDVSAAYAFTHLRQVVGVLTSTAERAITDDHDRRVFMREAREALAAVVPPGVIEGMASQTESGPPRFIMDMARQVGPDVMDKLFGGFLSYIILTLQDERGEDLPLPRELEKEIREAMDAFASAVAPEESAEPADDEQTA